jgi:hypothetical protein
MALNMSRCSLALFVFVLCFTPSLILAKTALSNTALSNTALSNTYLFLLYIQGYLKAKATSCRYIFFFWLTQ